ncbi:MAG: putative glycoside hydrolase, partial [Candidatus Glassbacteria bacterium]
MKLRAVFCLALGLALSVCLAAGRTPPQPAAAETPATVDSSAVETAVRGPDSAAAVTAAESADSIAAAADSLAVDTLVSAPPAVEPDSTAPLPVETDTLLKALASDTAAALPDTAKAALPADTLERAGQLIAEATARENPRVLRFNAIYLNSGSVASNKLMDRFIERARKYSLGGFVMDMKDDHGYLSYTSRLPLAKKIGSNTRRVGDTASLVRRVHESGLTVTARVVCFKDRLLAGYSENGAFPFAVLDSTTGSPWKQDNGEIWANPYHPEVHGYLSG